MTSQEDVYTWDTEDTLGFQASMVFSTNFKLIPLNYIPKKKGLTERQQQSNSNKVILWRHDGNDVTYDMSAAAPFPFFTSKFLLHLFFELLNLRSTTNSL